MRGWYGALAIILGGIAGTAVALAQQPAERFPIVVSKDTRYVAIVAGELHAYTILVDRKTGIVRKCSLTLEPDPSKCKELP